MTIGSNLLKRKIDQLKNGSQIDEFKDDDDFCNKIRNIPQSSNLKELNKRRKIRQRLKLVNKKIVEKNTDPLSNIQCFG